MKKQLDNIRRPTKILKTSRKIVNSLIILVLGILLGIISKWLDNLSINDVIWWQHLLGILDLRNVFSSLGIWFLIAVAISVFSNTSLRSSINVFLFFVGMTMSYHLYTVVFSGFNPARYMLIWYGLTLFSPFLAFICWYARGEGKISIIICSLILSVMFISSFNIGIIYVGLKSIIDLLIFMVTLIVLHTKFQNTIYSLIIGFILSLVFNFIVII